MNAIEKDRELTKIVARVQPVLHSIVDKLDCCPHEAIVLGYLSGAADGIKAGRIMKKRAAMLEPILREFLDGLDKYGLPDRG